jgi:chromosome partitioning protein
MTGQIITVVQQKGGAGKTTLTAQLATGYLKAGLSVATIDIDPQGSLSLWYAARMASLADENTLIHSQIQGWRLKKEADRLADECDIVLIDSPPHAESENSIAIRAADLVLIPVQPSPLDLWASRPTVQAVRSERAAAMFIFNRVPPRALLTENIAGKLADLGIPAAKQYLGNRVAYAASIAEGKGVVETSSVSPASLEIAALVKELRKLQSRPLKAAA